MIEALKYLQPNVTVPIDMETTAMLVNALRQAIAQRTWVGLTDEEMLECNMDGDFMVDREIAKLNVQAKLKEKNT